MSAPTVHVVGRLTAAPELRFTASGAAGHMATTRQVDLNLRGGCL